MMMGTSGCPFFLAASSLFLRSAMPFDFEHAVTTPFRMQPGLRKLAEGGPQFTPNHPASPHLREKLAVLHSQPEQALQIEPGFDALPALHAAMRQAAQEHPAALNLSSDGQLLAHALGWSVDDRGEVAALHPQAPQNIGQCLKALPASWRQAALFSLAIEEDLAIVDGRRASLPWLAVALPSHWDPRQKIGRHFAEVHAPVADNAVLVAAGEHLMKLVTGPQRWERFVWNMTRHPGLDAHPQRVPPTHWPAELDETELNQHTWFRSERQTFIPLPERGQAVFTIRVAVRPLAQAVDTPARAQRLHDAIASMSPAALAYRQLTEARPGLLRWLAARAACADSASTP